jgi:hypothetical protein
MTLKLAISKLILNHSVHREHGGFQLETQRLAPIAKIQTGAVKHATV